jgi:PilZ domain
MEKRAAPRHRVLRAGTIQLGDSSTNCMVRNLSSAGALLHVKSSVGIPEYFTLILSPDGRHMPCHVAWRTERQIGVAFE